MRNSERITFHQNETTLELLPLTKRSRTSAISIVLKKSNGATTKLYNYEGKKMISDISGFESVQIERKSVGIKISFVITIK
jgi:hypothetical protein